MIDSHAHLEQSDYDEDREEVINRCKNELKGVITCCAKPEDFELTMKMISTHKNFLFATAGIHPIYAPEIPPKKREKFLEVIRKNSAKIHGIGECGLDFKTAKEQNTRNEQKRVFKKQIQLSDALDLPLVIHARRAFQEATKILENFDQERVLMHFFSKETLLDRVLSNGWHITVNNTVLWSEEMQRIAKQASLERILLETDSPWLGGSKRNEPISIRSVAKKISELKDIKFRDVWEQCGRNSIEFFDLPLNINEEQND